MVYKCRVFLKMAFLTNPLVVCWFKREEMAGWNLLSTSAPNVHILLILQLTEKKEHENISLKDDSFNEL